MINLYNCLKKCGYSISFSYSKERPMNLKLKTFIAVCEQGSFTKAAEELSLTQPAVSQQIKSLEQDFRIEIFDKRKKARTYTTR